MSVQNSGLFNGLRLLEFLETRTRHIPLDDIMYKWGQFPPIYNQTDKKFQIISTGANKVPEHHSLLNDEMVDFISAMKTLRRANRFSASQTLLKEFNSRFRRVNIEDLSLVDIENSANEAIDIINNSGGVIFKWLDSHDEFHKAYNLMKKKKYSILVPDKLMQSQNYKLSKDKLMLFIEMVVETIYEYFELSYHNVKVPSERAQRLSNQLRDELINSGSMTTNSLTKELDKVNNMQEYRRTPISNVKKKMKALEKEITFLIGKKMSSKFSFDSATKGRPYPDVVILLVALFGYELSMKQANRHLSQYDDVDTI